MDKNPLLNIFVKQVIYDGQESAPKHICETGEPRWIRNLMNSEYTCRYVTFDILQIMIVPFGLSKEDLIAAKINNR